MVGFEVNRLTYPETGRNSEANQGRLLGLDRREMTNVEKRLPQRLHCTEWVLAPQKP